MKKVMLVTVVMVLGLFFMVNTASALVRGGVWTQPDVLPGTWVETYDGGGPGQPGNMLNANSTNPQWVLSGLEVLDPGAQLIGSGIDPVHGNYNEYMTDYGKGTLTVQPAAALWGDGFTVSGLTAVNINQSYMDGYLGFQLVGEGQIDETGQLVKLIANYLDQDTATTDPPGHTGELQDITLIISGGAQEAVPTLSQWGTIILLVLIAGSAVWYLRRRRAVA